MQILYVFDAHWFRCVFCFSNHCSCIFVRTRAPRRSATSKSCLWRLRHRVCVKCAGCVPQKWRDARTFDLVRRWHGSGDPTIGRRASVTRRTAPRSRVPRYGCIAISCPSRVPLRWSYNARVSGPYPITFGGCDVVEWHTNCNWFVVNKKNTHKSYRTLTHTFKHCWKVKVLFTTLILTKTIHVNIC
jgi:hypothetical protein